MPRTCFRLSLSFLTACTLCLHTTARAADWVWWEGEKPDTTTFNRTTHFDAVTFPENGYLLSDEEWLTHEGDRDDPPVTASYSVDIEDAATYHFFVRKFWLHGPFRWRFDTATWDTLGRDAVSLDGVTIRRHLNANWYGMGKVSLDKGAHTFELELVDEDGDRRKKQICALDCFLLTRGPYTPKGNTKPSGGFGIEASLNARYVTTEKELVLSVIATRPQDRFSVTFAPQQGDTVTADIAPVQGIAVWKQAITGAGGYAFTATATDSERPECTKTFTGFVMKRRDDGSVPTLSRELKVWVDLANHPQPPSIWTDWQLEYPSLADALMHPEEPYRDVKGFIARTAPSMTWGEDIPYTLYIPDSVDLSSPAPAMVYLHGLGGNFQAVPEYRQRFEKDYDTHPMIMIGPNGTVKTWYDDLGTVNVMEVVRDALKKYPVDPDRLYISGGSMGGAGCQSVARRYPDVFSGVCPAVGTWFDATGMADYATLPRMEQILRLRYDGGTYTVNHAHVPCIFATGTRDFSVPFSVMASARVNQLWGGDAEAWVYDAGHGLPGDKYRWENIREKFQAFTRTAPRERTRIRYRTEQMRFNTSGWVTVDEPLDWAPIVDVDCAKDEPDTGDLTCRLTNVRTVTLNPLGTIKAIHIGDQTIAVNREGPVTLTYGRKGWKVVEAAPTLSPEVKNPRRAGPLRDVLYTPFVCVYGTVDKAAELEAWARVSSFEGEAGWKGFHGGTQPSIAVLADTTVLADEKLLSTMSLVCFGGPEENAVVARLTIPEIPSSLPRADTATQAMSILRPSPWANDRYVVVNEASSVKAMKHPAHVQQSCDWAVYPTRRQYWPLHTSMNAGMFDRDWQ